MNPKEFINTSKYVITEWLNHLNQLILERKLNIPFSYSFSNVLRIAESPSHYICELIGAKLYKPSEKIILDCPEKPEKFNSTNSYFIPYTKQDNASATMKISADDILLAGLRLSTSHDYELVNKKINFPLPDNLINKKMGDTPLLIKSSVNTFTLNNMTLIKIDNLSLIYRYIPAAVIISKPMSSGDYEKWLRETLQKSFYGLVSHNLPLEHIIGINTHLKPIEECARQLLNLSTQHIHESKIDNFLHQNKTLFAKSLGYVEITKPKLKWVVREKDDPIESIPDYLMRNKNGTYDILDLKTGAIKYSSLTKGKRLKDGGFVRIRFVDYVSELISQLKDYERYFSHPENREWALKNEKIQIEPENLRLIGIIGNYNNFDDVRTNKALLSYEKNITIISYSHLVDLFRAVGEMNLN